MGTGRGGMMIGGRGCGGTMMMSWQTISPPAKVDNEGAKTAPASAMERSNRFIFRLDVRNWENTPGD